MATYLTMPSDLPSHAEGFKPDDTIDHQVLSIAQHWLSQFEHAAMNADGDLFASLFAQNGFWRDIIAFTNDYRSNRSANVAKAAKVRSDVTRFHVFKLMRRLVSPLPRPQTSPLR